MQHLVSFVPSVNLSKEGRVSTCGTGDITRQELSNRPALSGLGEYVRAHVPGEGASSHSPFIHTSKRAMGNIKGFGGGWQFDILYIL